MINIDEVIEHEKKVAEYYKKSKCNNYSDQHRQLAEWLEDYKRLKSKENAFFNFDETIRIECEKARAKAIDDFVKELKNEDSALWNQCDNWYEFADKIAEQLKGGA